MKTKTVAFGGKTWCLTVNQSGDLSPAKPEEFEDLKKKNPKLQKYTPEIIKLIQDAPRLGRNSHGKLRIKDDNGQPLIIGSKVLCRPGELANDSTGSTEDLRKHSKVLMEQANALKKIVPEDTFNFFYQAAQDPKSNAELQSENARLLAEIEELKKQMGQKK
ncbi:MAG: hypothetical protein J6Y02_03895 [Pseudobutyrivibrio sp.]|nr:hypothetical protein [Pseudobutyrivibrio sp.]